MILDKLQRVAVAYSMGITDADSDKWRLVYEQAIDIKYVCIDVANGYSERFLEYVKQSRNCILTLLLLLVMLLPRLKTQS